MTRVDEEAGVDEALEKAREYDRTVLLERWIEGPEYTAGVLGDVVLPLIRIETPHLFYDYEAMFLDALLSSGVISHTAVRLPRRGDLSTLN